MLPTHAYPRALALVALGFLACTEPDVVAPSTDQQGSALGTAVAPTDDTFVRSGNYAGRNYGSAATIDADATGGKNSVRRGYLKFDLSSFTNITKVTLTLYASDGSADAGRLVTTSDTSWKEGTLTWNSAPAPDGATAATLGKVVTGSTITVDLTAVAQAGGVLSLALVNASGDGVQFASKEVTDATRRPHLTVETSDVTPPPPPPPSGAMSVRVSGNRLVDQNGAPVQLRGVNRSGTQYACAEGWGLFDGPSDDASLDAMKAWHINAVRVNGNEDCWLGINGVPAAYSGANYQAAMGAFVQRIIAHGMYVIFDLHHSAPGSTLALDQQPMADRDHSPAYWASVAAYFKSNPAVIFDLYNEPYPDSNRNTTAAWTCLRDGGSCPGVNFVAAGMQELVNAVRGAGANNVIMIGGPQYAGVVDRWLEFKPNDPAGQLAASIHIYYDTPSNPDWSPCYLQSCWDGSMATLAATTPIIIGEVGEHDCNHGLIDGTALNPPQQSLLDWSDRHGVSYLGWSWIAGNCAAEPALISDYKGTPTNFGIGLRNHFLLFP